MAARITDPDEAIARLAALPGIGPWTAQYIAMRALHWPDAFPKEDIAIRNNLGGVTAKEAEVAVTGLAAMAELRGDARLAHGQTSRVTRCVTAGAMTC